LHGLARVNWKGGQVKTTILEIITINNNKKKDCEEIGGYISKGMYCIWFNLNFKIVLARDSPIKKKGSGICIGEWKPRNGKNIPSIRCE
jgi:hypothetical protein